MSLERNHGVTLVRDGDAAEGRDGSRDGVGAEEAEDSKHGKTSVVDFGDQPLLLGLLSHLGVEAKRIVEVEDEVDIVTEEVELRVLARLASSGVVGKDSTSALVPELQHGDDEEDLPLGGFRDGIPLGLRHEVRGRVGITSKSLGPREDEVGLDNVSNEGEHSNTSVLDLSVTEESDGSLVTDAVEVIVGKVDGVVELDDRVELLGQSLEGSLGLTELSLGGGGLGRGKGHSGGDQGKEDGALHGCYFSYFVKIEDARCAKLKLRQVEDLHIG